MDAISFNNGLSSISRVNDDLKNGDFPKSKSTLKPNGDHVVAHFWKALDLGKTFEYREKQFALNISGMNQSLTPEEYFAMTDKTLSFMKRHEAIGPEIKKAMAVIAESKALQEELLMLRNVLLPA
ncbi:hypothetical protein CI610_00088 [invertebrate metagenome]|uniref:Uncharacterized protein n=1 Tax=invertebrate metagenome TaxID=1711999 RepID=A0A2H9TCF2_9ZZZZ